MKKFIMAITITLTLVSPIKAIPPLTPIFDPTQGNKWITTISSDMAIKAAKLLDNELFKYNMDKLDAVNIHFYIGYPASDFRGGIASSRANETCNISLTYDEYTVDSSFAFTIHHEIFHCYDNRSNIAWDFSPSHFVIDRWSNIDDPSITVDFKGEEKASYFSSLMLNDLQYFNGNNDFHADPDMNQKITAIQPFVSELIRPGHRYQAWKNGKVLSFLELRFDGMLTTEVNFNYETQQYTIYNGYTKETLTLDI